MLKTPVGIPVALILISLTTVGCGPNLTGVGRCSDQKEQPGCVVESGTYSDYRVGMTTAQAFMIACTNWRPGRSGNLFLKRGDKRALLDVSICDAEREAFGADSWTFVEDPNDRRYVTLIFRQQKLSEIVIMARGGDL
jgi:hypothetical protein